MGVRAVDNFDGSFVLEDTVESVLVEQLTGTPHTSTDTTTFHDLRSPSLCQACCKNVRISRLIHEASLIFLTLCLFLVFCRVQLLLCCGLPHLFFTS
jgi:hypothetical protein